MRPPCGEWQVGRSRLWRQRQSSEASGALQICANVSRFWRRTFWCYFFLNIFPHRLLRRWWRSGSSARVIGYAPRANQEKHRCSVFQKILQYVRRGGCSLVWNLSRIACEFVQATFKRKISEKVRFFKKKNFPPYSNLVVFLLNLEKSVGLNQG